MQERILVIGAGVSGLAAGHRLMKQGFDVTVLDKADYIGGKAKTSKRNDGYIIDEGASILPSKYVHTINLIKELGLEAELQPGGSIIGFARGDKIHYMDSARLIQDSITTKLISLRSKLLMVRIAIDNFRIKPKLSYEDISLAAEFDFETAAQYTRRRGNEEIFEYIVDTTLRGLLGTSGETQSAVDFFFSFNNVIGSKLLSFKQGMGFLPHAIAARSGLDVRLNCQVSEVRTDGKDVEVSWTDPDGANTERVAGVVVALPAFAASAVVPELAPQAHEILKSFKYTTSVNINLGLEKPPKDIPAVVIQIPKSVHPDLFAIVLDHNKAPGRVPEGKGMASLYTMSDWAEELIKEDDETVLRKIIEAGEKVVPGLADGMEFSHINRWYPVIVYSEPGDYKKLIPLKQLLAQNPRIAFAGDYFSCSNLNTAIAGGERAARDICAEFGRT